MCVYIIISIYARAFALKKAYLFFLAHFEKKRISFPCSPFSEITLQKCKVLCFSIAHHSTTRFDYTIRKSFLLIISKNNLTSDIFVNKINSFRSHSPIIGSNLSNHISISHSQSQQPVTGEFPLNQLIRNFYFKSTNWRGSQSSLIM